MIEEKTYRWKGHSKSDAKKYRTKEEEQEWRTHRDPIKRCAQVLIEEGMATEEELKQLEEKAKKEIEESVIYAEQSPEPSIESLEEDVYA